MTPSPVVSRTPRASTIPVCPRGGLPGGRRERGAVLVHVAVAMTGLLAFSALTIDLGSLWVARGQAQNAVDAAALAGAISLAGNPDPSLAEAAARAIAQAHAIWGEPVPAGSLTVATGPCPTGSPAIAGECMTVAVQRGGGVGTPLPVFFSRLVSVTPTSLRASASAKVMTGNTSTCVRPLAIMDAWQPGSGTWSFGDQFAPPDVYVAPSSSGPGTGHTQASLNFRVSLGRGEVQFPVPPAGNEYFNLDISRVGSPGTEGDFAQREQRYLDNMATCNAVPVPIGEPVGYWDEGHEQTNAAAQSIIDSDPGAYWDGSTIRGSAFPVSPRLLTIALVDPQFYLTQQGLPISERRYVIRNLVGFFLEQANASVAGLSDPMVGILLRTNGSFSPSADNVAEESAFLKNVALVR